MSFLRHIFIIQLLCNCICSRRKIVNLNNTAAVCLHRLIYTASNTAVNFLNIFFIILSFLQKKTHHFDAPDIYYYLVVVFVVFNLFLCPLAVGVFWFAVGVLAGRICSYSYIVYPIFPFCFYF